MAKVLTNEAIDTVKKNNQLGCNVADALGIEWSALRGTLDRKSRRLTEVPVLKVIADFLHCEMDDLLIDDTKVEA